MNVDTGIVAATIAGLNILFTVGGGFYFMGRVTGRLDAHEANTSRIERDVREVKELLITSAVEAERVRRAEADIENLETDLRNLRRGVGWINNTDDAGRGVQREYR